MNYILALLLLFPLPTVPLSQPFPQPVEQRKVVHVASIMEILRSVGFTGQALNMAYAIVMAESSGNARAFNGNANTGDRSYGLFQINMLGDMGPERRRQYGLKSNDDLFDPYVNARVAFKMSNGGKNWTPWSTYNRGDYKRFLGGADQEVRNSGGGGGGSGGGGGGGSAPEKKSDKELAEEYGFVEAMLNAIPELKSLFQRATKEGWSASKFQSEVRDTKWFKTHTDTERQWLITTYGDPATAGEKWRQAWTHIRQFGNALGLEESKDVWKKFSDWAYKVVALGWDDNRLREDMGKWLNYNKGKRQGEGGEVQDKLREYAYSMGVVMSEQWYADNTRAVVRGIATLEDYKDQIRRQAMAMYGAWAKQIDNGQTVSDLASPYLQTMSQLLELAPGSVNLFDPTIKKALQYKDPVTGENKVKDLWQFENELRSDKRWLKTNNAQNTMMGVAHQILADFGFKY